MKSKHIENLDSTKTDECFWLYVIEHKKDLKVILDNDKTYVSDESIDYDGENEYEEFSEPMEYLGDSDGVQSLLLALGIFYELV